MPKTKYAITHFENVTIAFFVYLHNNGIDVNWRGRNRIFLKCDEQMATYISIMFGVRLEKR